MKKVFFYCLFFFISSFSFSQKHVERYYLSDENYVIIESTIYDFDQLSTDSLYYHQKIAKEYLKNLDEEKDRFKAMGAYHYLMHTYIHLKKYDTVLSLLYQALELPDAKNSKGAIDMYWGIFYIYKNFDNFVGQLEQLIPLEKLGLKYNYYKETDASNIRKMRGDVLINAGYYEEASTYYKEYIIKDSLDIDPLKFAVAANDLACIYEELNQRDSVLKYRNIALKSFKPKKPTIFKPEYEKFIEDYIILHKFWYEKSFNEYTLEFAKKFSENALKNFEGEPHTAIYANHFIATYYFEKKQYELALYYIENTFKIGEKRTSLKKLQDLYAFKSRILDKLGKEELATKNLQEIRSIKNEQFARNRALDLTKYQVDEIKNQKEDAERLAAENETKRKYTTYLLILAIIILILTGIGFTITNQKNKRIKAAEKKVKQELKEKEFLLRELNHRVKNNLALILSLIRFQQDETEDAFYKEKFQSLENRIKTIASAHEQLLYNKDNLDGENYDVEDYLSEIVNALLDLSTRKVYLDLNISKFKLNIDTILPIGILINELVSNTLKHAVSKKLQINISIKLEENQVLISYKDSGIGFKVENNEKRLGLNIIESMVLQLKGSLKREGSAYEIRVEMKNMKQIA